MISYRLVYSSIHVQILIIRLPGLWRSIVDDHYIYVKAKAKSPSRWLREWRFVVVMPNVTLESSNFICRYFRHSCNLYQRVESDRQPRWYSQTDRRCRNGKSSRRFAGKFPGVIRWVLITCIDGSNGSLAIFEDWNNLTMLMPSCRKIGIQTRYSFWRLAGKFSAFI